MLSASHNPMPDNGIKFFARGGVKLDDAIEAAIEKRLREPWTGPPGRGSGGSRRTTRRSPTTPGTSSRPSAARSTGIRVVLDCAHGAASVVGPLALREAGAEVVAICARARRPEHQRRLRVHPPRGAAARRSSSTAPTPASRSTATPTAAWPSTPTATSSTATSCWPILALAMRDAGTLKDDTVVATVMSNLGFVQAMRPRARRGPADQGRRPLRARGDEGVRLHARRRAVRARDHERPRHHRRRHPHRAARAGADGRAGRVAGRRWPG